MPAYIYFTPITMATKKNANKPVDSRSIHGVHASIFRNKPKQGKNPFYRANIIGRYQDDQGEYHDSSSYSEAQLAVLESHARWARERIWELQKEDWKKKSKDEDQEDDDSDDE